MEHRERTYNALGTGIRVLQSEEESTRSLLVGKGGTRETTPEKDVGSEHAAHREVSKYGAHRGEKESDFARVGTSGTLHREAADHEISQRTCKGQLSSAKNRTYEVAMGDEIYYCHESSSLHTGPDAKSCTKNPYHKDFIPINEFTEEHLSDDCLDRKGYFDYLKSAADLVVHIYTWKVSTERPAEFPSHNKSDGSTLRFGSGYVLLSVLCGHSYQGVEVLNDFIEKLLEQYKLSDLSGGRDRGPSSDFERDPRIDVSTRRIVDNVGWIIDEWLKENLLGTSGRVLDDFAEDLIRKIDTCKGSQTFGKNEGVTGSYERSACTTTLNDYRKAKCLSVSEFCLAICRGVKVADMKGLKDILYLQDKPCPCSKCKRTVDPKRNWWMVIVKTAAHVIYDEQEADGATVHLFYDDSASKPVITRGVCGNESSLVPHGKKIDADVNCFVCALHDDEVGKRLTRHIESVTSKQRYFRGLKGPRPVAVIAHPHGSTKHITLGEECPSDDFTRIEYTAKTCPGSSGGAVIGGNFFLFDFLNKSHSKSLDNSRSKSGCNMFPFYDS